MTAYTVLGYAYDGALHCVACANAHWGPESLASNAVLDSAGEHPEPLFAAQADAYEVCDDCGDVIWEGPEDPGDCFRGEE